jgi:hypothetical protein
MSPLLSLLSRSTRRRPAFCRPVSRPRLEALDDRVAPAILSTIAYFVPYPNGNLPQAGLIEDSSGNLFGTTEGKR